VTIAERWSAVRARVDAACARAGRSPSDVAIVAVTKTHPASAIIEAIAAGVTDVGENYAQELLAKRDAVAAAGGGAARWHFIGRLQRNKAKLVAGNVALIHAVDGAELGAEIGKRAVAAGAIQPVLVAVNLAGEATKGGVAAADVPALVDALTAIAGVRVDGLMTMPPPDDDDLARRCFAGLRELRDRVATAARPLPVLSMGMSGDFEIAIEEGATLVRIGTAIFGSRPAASE
jgi:pyridoxal phosphate enzyme (YggS family)